MDRDAATFGATQPASTEAKGEDETLTARAYRLLRQDILSGALAPGMKLRIDTLCKALGVTKGSFYWHFEDRDDFVRSVVEFWSKNFTDPVVEQISQRGGSAADRLKSLMQTVSDGDFDEKRVQRDL